MDDLISRQAAIDALARFVPYAICDVQTESYTNGLTDAYNLICQLPSAQPEQQWIPCSERLPEDGRVVLWCNEHGSVFATAITARRGESWAVGKRHRRSKIIAWMPLPEPYEESGEDE